MALDSIENRVLDQIEDEIDEWYEELIDEIFIRSEQSVGAQIHPPAQKKEDGGDE